MSVLKLDSCAIIVKQGEDNVAVVKKELAVGSEVDLGDRTVCITAEVVAGHRFATNDIPEGDHVIQYGQPIGTSRGIAMGDPVTTQNMSDDVPVVRDLPGDLSTPEPEYVPREERTTFRGFRRPDGRVGTRNFILVVPTSMCASHEALQISTLAEFTLHSPEKHPNVDGVSAIPHN